MNIKNMRRAMDFDVEDVLDLIGLERKRSMLAATLTTIGVLAAGVAIGAAVGVLVAPSSRRKLRREAEEKLSEVRERFRGNNVETRVSSPVSTP